MFVWHLQRPFGSQMTQSPFHVELLKDQITFTYSLLLTFSTNGEKILEG